MRTAILVLACVALACSGAGKNAPDDGLDADVVGPGDPGAADTGAAEATPEACVTPDPGVHAPPVPEPSKFALAVFHFNVQYVPGGLKGLIPPEQDPDGNFDLTDEQLQDVIIAQTLAPLLDMLWNHPSFGADIEMQGLMVDCLRERHPPVLDRLRALVERGQVEVVSFHYSDQLFTAHSRWSMERSIELNRAAFGAACLPLSSVVFTQEGQFSEGMLELMKTAGQTIGVLKGGLFEYVHGSKKPAALYSMRGQDVVVTRGFDAPDLAVTWYFVDDGELAMTGGKDPYLGKFMVFDPVAEAKMVKKLTDLEAQGYFITTISDHVKRVKAKGVTPEAIPFMLDGTWHPENSENLFAWMGRGGLWSADEADNEVLTTREQARIALEAAFAALAWAKAEGMAVQAPELGAKLATGARDLVLAEVSDATGWNPWKGEVQYGLGHAKAALDAAQEVGAAVVKACGGPHVQVDLASGKVEKMTYEPGIDPWTPADAPIEVAVKAPHFNIKPGWMKHGKYAGPGELFRLGLKLVKEEAGATAAEIAFPRTEAVLTYSPAMLEGEVQSHPLDSISDPSPNVALANGLAGLGNGVFLVKDIRTFHLSASFPRDQPAVLFRDQTLNGPGPYDFTFYVLKGVTAEQAREFAWRTNVKPAVVF